MTALETSLSEKLFGKESLSLLHTDQNFALAILITYSY